MDLFCNGGVLGVLGGMGPLASAEFVRTIYRCQAGGVEQRLTRVLLDSDPTFPDRTEEIRAGRVDELAARLTVKLRSLVDQGATTVVIACVTAHHFLPFVQPTLRERVLSLVDVTVDELSSRHGRHLMLSTSGTRQARVFENAPGWGRVADRVVMPGADDQELVHGLAYRMKRGGGSPEVVDAVERLARRYDCRAVIVGCTEFHLVSGDLPAVDALRTIATRGVVGSFATT